MVQKHTPALSTGKASSQAEKSVLCQGTTSVVPKKSGAQRLPWFGRLACQAPACDRDRTPRLLPRRISDGKTTQFSCTLAANPPTVSKQTLFPSLHQHDPRLKWRMHMAESHRPSRGINWNAVTALCTLTLAGAAIVALWFTERQISALRTETERQISEFHE